MTAADTVHKIIDAIRKPSEDRAAFYMRRLEAQLTLEADGLAFLKREHAKWMARYRGWARRVDDGTATDADLMQSAWDYLETITALDKRIATFKREAA